VHKQALMTTVSQQAKVARKFGSNDSASSAVVARSRDDAFSVAIFPPDSSKVPTTRGKSLAKRCACWCCESQPAARLKVTSILARDSVANAPILVGDERFRLQLPRWSTCDANGKCEKQKVTPKVCDRVESMRRAKRSGWWWNW
jgi:hypothetical protein